MQQEIEDRIKRLGTFKVRLREWERINDQTLREEINQEKAWVHREVAQLGCLKVFTISPPPAVGGMIMRNVDLFDHLFDRIYTEPVIPMVIDMIDDAIGRLKSGMIPTAKAATKPQTEVGIEATVQQGYAFIVMAIDPNDPALEDVLDAIKEGAMRCGITAERIDEVQASERITDRILESIRRAQYVIVDVTHPKPNVFYEAGFAHGIGKLPIYVARTGTPLQFDLKDYPTIFFRSMKELKDGLEKRLRALAEASAK
ncbi:hypothetical protein M3A49_24365 [Paraburkholderia sp. CNPSo 3076]|uniref:hypothetical protein n=1 Tax=Paraburkholderia sp. CNPSo 3076 TaxID=2940936 RepID=UPI0022537890|nr:hypothetical protein [Paraburkholderia sp. CNPSo 3076]MCX5542595.1 hypothetical protein [Paraburkholderia sp. CNPSo 3076]